MNEDENPRLNPLGELGPGCACGSGTHMYESVFTNEAEKRIETSPVAICSKCGRRFNMGHTTMEPFSEEQMAALPPGEGRRAVVNLTDDEPLVVSGAVSAHVDEARTVLVVIGPPEVRERVKVDKGKKAKDFKPEEAPGYEVSYGSKSKTWTVTELEPHLAEIVMKKVLSWDIYAE